MGAGHSHEPGESLPPAPADLRRIVTAIIVPLVVATVIGLIVLWPRGPSPQQASDTTQRLHGEIVSATPACPREVPAQPGGDCGTAQVRIGDKVVDAVVPTGPSAPVVGVGDDVVLIGSVDAEGGQRYAVVDHDRWGWLLALVALFVAAVIAFARWRGVASLVGLVVSFAVLLAFILPAIVRGEPPLWVAIVGSAAIMFAVIYLTHGVSVGTSMALLGTLAALVLTGLLGLLTTNLLHLTGSGSDEAAILANVLAGVDLRGLLLAGIIIGTLGVLDDVAITQLAIVGELSLADPTLGARQLYRSAIKVGRSHVASVVNTIILAYAGASLPLMLLLVTAGTRTRDVLSTQVMAAEIVRGVVGTIGLIAAVPITTALAAWAIARSHGEAAHSHAQPVEPDAA
ncbi:YibE/F family protein [Catellatospora citrea]|uniref:Membrane protein n=1 Tax=Catellatospora citrea TaxID=53366 RepID=A0A8J3P3Y1_9ACTN|nr:YibE/F family protein [Catellatospora citrea]RKE09625.1 putative membrane protein [Catellatospora citrea]GIG02794.1 membrane protein [Catellatospora citrea]